MKLNLEMWRKAVTVIPKIEDTEWLRLDFVSRWLISSRFAVVILTIISAVVAGVLAYRVGAVNVAIWLVLVIALIFAHVTNNQINDLVDFRKGIDRDNYYRSQYGPQPLDRGFVTERQQLVSIVANCLIAVVLGVVLVLYRGGLTLPLMLIGMIFLIFYTYPLKYLGLGELSVLIVWGPCMIGGGYYVLTGYWDWNIIFASLPFAISATLVIFGKHIDKAEMDREKGVRTLPVLIGERAARVVALALVGLQYVVVIALVATRFFTPVVLLVLMSLPMFFKNMLSMFRHPKPSERPPDYPAEAWPLWFVGSAFLYTRRFGLLYLAGVVIDTVLQRTVFA
jgi:1,4-dihydroxy-2-naphthoate polyprenyltransferase